MQRRVSQSALKIRGSILELASKRPGATGEGERGYHESCDRKDAILSRGGAGRCEK